ncbi:hypothetical protein B4109_1213 [Geobacillus stearothermophilus]|uniref:Uncharacterized protein n=1 Tax=Geobacillus stearothermophilus TaxID=1422 RepID=A0A150MUG1_GEOSE|nr:hypothetical protein B4109_1213 [Geobacillus stearothermophilus]
MLGKCAPPSAAFFLEEKWTRLRPKFGRIQKQNGEVKL